MRICWGNIFDFWIINTKNKSDWCRLRLMIFETNLHICHLSIFLFSQEKQLQLFTEKNYGKFWNRWFFKGGDLRSMSGYEIWPITKLISDSKWQPNIALCIHAIRCYIRLVRFCLLQGKRIMHVCGQLFVYQLGRRVVRRLKQLCITSLPVFMNIHNSNY